MSEGLSGRHVLFLAPRFFGYDIDIAQELRGRGAIVDVLVDRPFDTPMMKAITRFRPELVLGAASRVYRRKLEEFGRSGYDIVFVINGQTLAEPMLRELKAAYPRAKFVLYMWDSFRNRPGALENLKYFDDCLSFDRDSANTFGLRFRPLFFSRDFQSTECGDVMHHLSFVGTAHTDRYAIVRRIADRLPDRVRFYRYLYLQAPWVYHVLRSTSSHFRGARREDFRFVPLDRAAVRRAFFESRAVLDIEHPRQSGLTIRTLETLGAGRKLVTTNARVSEYDFYRADNVRVIQRSSAEVPVDFLDEPYVPLAPHIYRKYSLAGWMDEVIGASSTNH